MPAGTLPDAQAIAHDVATILDGLVAELDADADRALNAGRTDDARVLGRRVEELSRQSARLRGV